MEAVQGDNKLTVFVNHELLIVCVCIKDSHSFIIFLARLFKKN